MLDNYIGTRCSCRQFYEKYYYENKTGTKPSNECYKPEKES